MPLPYDSLQGELPTRQDPLTMLLEAAAPGARTPLQVGNPVPGKTGVKPLSSQLRGGGSGPGLTGQQMLGMRRNRMKESDRLNEELTGLYTELAGAMEKCQRGDQFYCAKVDALQVQIERKRQLYEQALAKEKEKEQMRSGPTSSTQGGNSGIIESEDDRLRRMYGGSVVLPSAQ